MSIAGRVLIVLVALALVAWIVLMAQVDQLNRNWGESIAKKDERIEQLQAQVAQLQVDARKATEQVRLMQARTDDDTAVLRAQLADVVKMQSETLEAASRYQFGVARAQAQAEAAAATLARREEEKAQTEQKLQDARQSLDALDARSNELLGELTSLREDFQQTLAANRARVRSALEEQGRGRHVRPASFVR